MKPITVVGGGDTGAAWAQLYATAHENLLKRIEEHKINYQPFLPANDVVVVWRMPAKKQETFFDKEGKFLIPETYRKDVMPYSLGVLLFAGPAAWDKLTEFGALPGDYVKFGQFAGEEEAVHLVNEAIDVSKVQGLSEEQTAEIAMKQKYADLAKDKVLQIFSGDVQGSVDIFHRMYGENPTMELVREQSPKGPMHVVRPIIR